MSRRAKKVRPEPFTEGSLADIYRWFFGKLNFLKPENYSLRDWEEHLFDVKHRDIARYIVAKPFKMPGLYYMAGALRVQGVGYRSMEPGDVLWVRTDARTEKADIEVLAGQGKKEQVFELDGSQWGWVRLHLDEAERA